MKIYLPVLVFILGVLSGFAQEKPPATPRVIRCEDQKLCSSFFQDGRRVFVLSSEDWIVSVSMMTIDGYFSSAIGITNRSGNRSDVFPSQFHLDLINPNKPEKPTALRIQTVEKIMRNKRWATIIFGSISEVATSMQKVRANIDSREIIQTPAGPIYSSSHTSVSMPDVAARERVIAENKESQANISAESMTLHDMELVFFQRIPRIWKRDLCLIVPIGDSIFEFPLAQSDFLEKH
jgi:hypothetical protein